MALLDLLDIPFVLAKWQTDTGAKGRTIDWLVIHDMEAAETDKTAENVAKNFATTTRKASAHYQIDNNSVVQSVEDMDVAYAAPGANHNGLHFEHAGYASQRLDQWLDPYSLAELVISSDLLRLKAKQYNIPVEYVDAERLRKGKRGITTHMQVSLAFGKTDHTDPGPNFPMELYLNMIRGKTVISPPPLVTPQEGRRIVVNAAMSAIIVHPSWEGYIQIGQDGGTFSQRAPNFGSLGGTKLNRPIVGGYATVTGKGYWLVADDGGVFAFGDAKFYGSTGNIQLNKPVVGIAPTNTGKGYWLVASDGGLFAFGDAEYFGSAKFKG